MILPACHPERFGFFLLEYFAFKNLSSLCFVLPLLPSFSLALLLLNQILYNFIPRQIHLSSKTTIWHQNQTNFQSNFPWCFFSSLSGQIKSITRILASLYPFILTGYFIVHLFSLLRGPITNSCKELFIILSHCLRFAFVCNKQCLAELIFLKYQGR